MHDLLPPNATDFERSLSLTGSRIEAVEVPLPQLLDPMTCPISVLPFLAWAYSVDHWDPTWPEKVRRQVVAASLKVHKIKGTPGAVYDALTALDLDSNIEEWFEYDGDAYHFRVAIDIATRGLTEEEIGGALAVVMNTKNLRSVLDVIELRIATRATPQFGMTLVAGGDITVLPFLPEDQDLNTVTFCATAMNYGATITVIPQGAA